MLKLNSKLLATAAFLCTAGMALAQDSQALIDTLIRKGIISADEAKAIQAEAKKSASQVATTISAKMYVDVSTITAETDAGVKVDPSGPGLDIKRFYLGVTHQFDGMWSANITTDVGYSSATGAVNPFIKTAFVQAKFSPQAIVQVGSAGQPWIPFVEDNYGFRYVENTLTDRLHLGNSADWGVHFLGSSGMVSYNFAAVNGGGYKNPTRTNSVDYEGRLSVEPVKGLVFAVGGYTGDLGKDSNSAPAKQTANRFDVMVNYTAANFKVGAEYFTEDNWGATTSATADSGDGYSVWGQYKFDKTWSVFARYDNDKTSKDVHPSFQDTYFNLGVQCAVIKGVDVSLVWKNDNIDHPTSASMVTSYDELGLFAQIAF
jgi:polyhydroxyalkanoate synthesis regulator phasin